MNRIASRDSARLLAAPFLGMLAGFLLNRARGGAEGFALISEMLLGAMAVVAGCVVLARVARWIESRAVQGQQQLAELHQEAEVRRMALVQAEAERYRAERLLREQASQARAQAAALGNELRRATEKMERIETEGLSAEAQRRIAALEAAQQALLSQSAEADTRSLREAEDLKASLRQLAISESTRQRNAEGPENDQSGRIIELESRIRRLAREIEKLSNRQPAASTGSGQAHSTGSGQAVASEAKVGFLRAMLDANKTLREQIKEAA